LDGEQFQTVTVTLHNGKVVKATKQKPVKFDKPPARRRNPERK